MDPLVRIECPAGISQLMYQAKLCQKLRTFHVTYPEHDLRIGICHMIEYDGFDVQRPLDKAQWTSQSPWVRADAQ